MKAPRRFVLGAAVLVVLLLGGAVSAAGADDADLSALQVDPGAALAVGSPVGAAGNTVNAVVRLADPPLAVAYKQAGGMNQGQQQAYVKSLRDKQDALKGRLNGLGARQLASLTKALNAVVVSVDAAKLKDVAALPGVDSVQPIGDYQLDLSETVPYIGAKAVQDAGFDGTGVKVAVLDTGVDYTHQDLGGPGTAAAYTAAYGTTTADPRNTTRDGLFPTSKVIAGTDFVGEKWNGTATSPPLANDDDPIDCGPSAIPSPCAGGHGSHVSDIIGGVGPAKGVAPGAKLIAIKVCSSVSSACSGVALLEGVDFALDPNGDGDISDRANVMNLSLGSNYGQREDDLSAALSNAVGLGVVVAAAAGNAGDRPYIVSSPSTAQGVISVAQTQVPSAAAFFLHVNSPAAIAGDYKNTETVGWAPIGGGFTGDVAYVGRGCPAGSISPGSAADPYLASPAGKVALIDRGACAVSLKVDRAAKAGAIGVLIGLVAPGDPVSFSFGGGDTFVPTLILTQATANLIKANIAAPVNVTVGPQFKTPLVGSMVSSSARGPSVSENAIKPDIGAPGASVSAEAGTGTGTTSFGGTSGATPMIAGSAALLLDAHPGLSPAEVKSLLMNTAETNIQINPALSPGVLAPITRIGGGEVRVDRAVASKTAAWDADAAVGSLSFGYDAVSGSKTYVKKLVVRNYDSVGHTYTVTPSFRYSGDATGAVSLDAPSTVAVGANSSKQISVQLKVDPSKLPVWSLNGGSRGGDGFRLQDVEFDGYITLNGGANNTVHVAWQYLPHRAADVHAASTNVALSGGTGQVQLQNSSGALAGRTEVFSLTGASPKIGTGFLPKPGDNFAVIDLESVGARLVSIGGGQFGVQFGIDTWGRRSVATYPAEFDVYIDSNRDGTPDFIVFNSENGGFGVTGQDVVSVFNVATGTVVGTFFFADADLDSGNAILTAPLSAVGLTPGTKFDFSVFAFDNYFTGFLTDAIQNMTYTLSTPRFVGSGIPATGVPAGGSSTLAIQSVAGGDTASPSQTGLLLLYRDAKSTGNSGLSEGEADAITVTP